MMMRYRYLKVIQGLILCAGRFDHYMSSVHVHKKVPTGAGLGGGSSNAAIALWAANQLSGCLATEKELQEWSDEIASDVRCFFSNGAAYCTCRGEDSVSLRMDTIVDFAPAYFSQYAFIVNDMINCDKSLPFQGRLNHHPSYQQLGHTTLVLAEMRRSFNQQFIQYYDLEEILVVFSIGSLEVGERLPGIDASTDAAAVTSTSRNGISIGETVSQSLTEP